MTRADRSTSAADRAVGSDARTARAPAEAAGVVSRTALVNRLRASTHSVVLVTAPAGYGKTTLLAQWAARDGRPFLWIAADRGDREPAGFLRHLAEALDDVAPLEPHVREAVADPGPSVWTSALPRLAGALLAAGPLVVVVDDAHVLGTSEVHEAVAALAAHLSEGSMLVVSGRRSPPLPVPALRAADVVVEIGAEELAFTPREAQLLLRAAGRTDDVESATALAHELEGWPAALALAAAERDGDVATRAQAVETYVQREFIAPLQPGLRRFLRRAAVLDELSASLCDSVLRQEGSGAMLAAAERTGILVTADRHPATYRYRRLFRESLRHELVAREPGAARALHGRAADWYEGHGLLESAVRHALAAGDLDRAARIVGAIALPLYHAGRAPRVEAWLTMLDQPAVLGRHPGVAVQGGLIHALRGRPDDAQRWVAAAEAGSAALRRPRAAAAVRARAAAVRSVLCLDGAHRMVADAETALAGLGHDDALRPVALAALGFGYVLLGEHARADEILATAASEAARLGATDTRAIAVAQRSVLAAARDDPEAAGTLALEARGIVDEGELLGYATCAIALAVSARRCLRQGRWEDARAELARARIGGQRGHTVPWLAVQTGIEVGRAHLALRETVAVRALLDDLRAQLRVHRRLGTLVDEVDALERDFERDPMTARENTGLTAAELRLLPFLSTHLSFREIGERLYVSRNTIKTQAISIYRKLGATSRSDAVGVAARLGLVDRAPDDGRGRTAD